MRVLSLGWGVQSFTLAAMSALGEIEPFDVALHADTKHESILTYQFVNRWTKWLIDHGLKVITVCNKTNEIVEQCSRSMRTPIPAFTQIPGNKTKGQLHRQCTRNWKIYPMRRWLQANRNKQPIEQCIGISLDEFQRMKPSDRKYIVNRWPLIEIKMTRIDCINWLSNRNLEIPPKSACVFCPYRSNAEWTQVLTTSEDYSKAIAADHAIRSVRPPFDLFIHPSRKPFELISFHNQNKNQMSLWDQECTGICGV
jgi:hypothetical protein